MNVAAKGLNKSCAVEGLGFRVGKRSAKSWKVFAASFSDLPSSSYLPFTLMSVLCSKPFTF